VHEHFDADGNLTGTTVVTRESMWDDESRGRALRLAEFEAGKCPCGCGLPAKVSTSKTVGMTVDTFTCYASRALAMEKRKQRKEIGQTKDGKEIVGWDDGLNYYVVPADRPD
jgi:hypothetical protein